MSPVRRIIVGVSGSPRGLPALRYAADLAHTHGGALFAVHAWAPSAMELAGHHYPAVLVQEWEDAAWQRLWAALDAAFGGLQHGLRVQPTIAVGSPGRILVHAASRPDDLLVIGAGRRGLARCRGHGTVSRYCLAHASCPVIAVPPPALPRPKALWPDSGHAARKKLPAH
jgi:nucleotide-binding universal stress UspA family protein